MKKPKVVVMGGGTGTFAVTSALKLLDCEISTIIAVSDSGGSTGRIRDEFGFQPVGDLRQSLAALADTKGQQWIQKILLYRFEKGNGLKGHNLGNLILTALQDMTKDTTRALRIAEKVFNLQGSVIPVTDKNVDLQINYADGTAVTGEHILDEDAEVIKQISSVELVPSCSLNPKAETALTQADLIIIGPGDYYASIMATLTVDGIKQAFAATKGRIAYISNLMTRRTQTHNLPASKHTQGIEQAIGRPVDRIILNQAPIPKSILKSYAQAQEFEVQDDFNSDDRVLRAELISQVTSSKTASDTAYRSLLRHDPKKLAKVIHHLLDQP
jgi:uncharacterized cofD-like protein